MQWGVGAMFKREGTYVYLSSIHAVLWQKHNIVKQLCSNFKKFLREKKYLHCRMVILDTQSRLPMRTQGAVWRVFTVKATAKLV